jgi:DNA-binding CsgD family transcriptional regulator
LPAPISCPALAIGLAGVLREGRRMTDTLKDRLREELLKQVRTGLPVTYKELADRLALSPPHTIQHITDALERLMEEDVAMGHPLLAAFAVSKAQPGIPARGFFLKAQALGVFSGDPAGQEAFDFHARELRRVSLRAGR